MKKTVKTKKIVQYLKHTKKNLSNYLKKINSS